MTFADRLEEQLRAVEASIVPGTDWGREFQEIIDKTRADARNGDAMDLDESLAQVTAMVARHRARQDQSATQGQTEN
ncbi:hypothetical protein FB565_006579 [Actinoplanes lutulentus]|uniref:Uncharacterized protein n=1 Tax=Actinoplanes lutulentus TaxID=1287878 RepID=A0A327ZAS5_9ACTN|nr:hypothetical protein [Actinoplanes lutulentus]MBB2946811.1 hypothetical protein [Actinoplanes lutulentus]RAK35703.1 hypothetical protein B0I29_109177 [Actinoplanes lutulentus]